MSTLPMFGSATPVQDVVARIARALWPNKTARHLASRCGRTTRSAEAWLAGETGMNADALADLLRSDQGLAFLDAIISDGASAPSWWPAFQREVKAHAIARRLDELKSEIEEARHGLGLDGEVRPVAGGPRPGGR